uniref:DDE-1 domain-containing protein n=1 Tax=Romanomermis culicivorax TaxID=13658 RepID=A0A915HXZ5_ROMCU
MIFMRACCYMLTGKEVMYKFQDVMQQPGAHHSTICIDEWRAHLNLDDPGYIHQTRFSCLHIIPYFPAESVSTPANIDDLDNLRDPRFPLLPLPPHSILLLVPLSKNELIVIKIISSISDHKQASFQPNVRGPPPPALIQENYLLGLRRQWTNWVFPHSPVAEFGHTMSPGKTSPILPTPERCRTAC